MKTAIILAFAIFLGQTSSAANDSNSRDGGGGYGPFGQGYRIIRPDSDVLICQCRELNEGFADMIPYYEAELVDLGATVSAIDAPSGGGAWPDPYDPETYCITYVVTGENWWGPNFGRDDEEVLFAYMQAGGGVFLSGQDYLYGSGYPDDLTFLGRFPYYMGAFSYENDAVSGETEMTVVG
jgi:hypothetical protein